MKRAPGKNSSAWGLPVKAKNFPQEIILLPRWTGWAASPRPGQINKWDKKPVVSIGGSIQGLRWTDPAQWRTFDEVYAEYVANDQISGVGFIMNQISEGVFGEDLVVFDLDNAVIDGEINPVARQVMEQFPTYWELSPSGTGLRGIIRGNIEVEVTTSRCEVYDGRSNRFVTITGHQIPGTCNQVQWADPGALNDFIQSHRAGNKSAAHSRADKPMPELLSEEKASVLIERLRKSCNDDLLKYVDTGETVGRYDNAGSLSEVVAAFIATAFTAGFSDEQVLSMLWFHEHTQVYYKPDRANLHCAPETVRIMLTGNSDQDTAVQAINEGDVFRFLNKPCEPKTLGASILAGFKQYDLIRAERILLGETLTGAVHALGEVLSLVNPAAFGKIARIQRHMKGIAKLVDIGDDWKLDVFPTLSQIGCINLSPEVLKKAHERPGMLTTEEKSLYETFPTTSGQLISNIPRLEEIELATKYLLKNFDGTGFPDDDLKGSDIPLLARLYRIASAYDGFESNDVTACLVMSKIHETAAWYDPVLIDGLERYVTRISNDSIESLPIDALESGSVLAGDVVGLDGVLLVARGQVVSETIRERLTAFLKLGKIENTVSIYGNQSR